MQVLEIFFLGFFSVGTFDVYWPIGMFLICILSTLLYGDSIFSLAACIPGAMLFRLFDNAKRPMKLRGAVDLILPVAAFCFNWPALCILAAIFTADHVVLSLTIIIYVLQQWADLRDIYLILVVLMIPYGMIGWSKVARR